MQLLQNLCSKQMSMKLFQVFGRSKFWRLDFGPKPEIDIRALKAVCQADLIPRRSILQKQFYHFANLCRPLQ